MDCVNYDNFANFKKRVLLPALADVNTYTELKVEVDYRKTGRINTHLLFTISNLNESTLSADIEEAHRRFYNTEAEIYQLSFFDSLVIPGGQNGNETE